EKAHECIAPEKPGENASRYQTEAVEKHEPKNASLLCSQRHANANFVGAQGDAIGHHARNANYDEQKTNAGEGAKGDNFKLWSAVELSQRAFECSSCRDSNIWINRPHFLPNGLQNQCWVIGCPCHAI